MTSQWSLLAAAAVCMLAAAAIPAQARDLKQTAAGAAAAGARPARVIVTATQVRPSLITLTDDTYNFNWEPGTTQRAVLRVLGNDKGQGLTIKSLNVPASVKGKPFIPERNKKVIVYRVVNYSGALIEDTFTYEAIDNSSTPTTQTAQVKVTVSPGALPPTRGAKPDTFAFNAKKGESISEVLNVLGNDVGDQLEIFDVTPLPAGSTLKGTLQISADKKSITYSLDNFDGAKFSEAFRYRVKDLSLEPGAVGALTGARVDISVATSGGQPLQAVGDVYNLNLNIGSAGDSWDLPVLLNDKGVGLSITSFSNIAPFTGALSIAAGKQSITYKQTFTNGYDGTPITESFKYTVKNSTGATAQATVQVKMTQEALNANPDAWSFKLDAAGNLPLKVLDIFANDTGVIVNANVSWAPPDQGDLTWNQQKSYFEYSVTNYRGPSYSFEIEYTIDDGNGNKDSTLATVYFDASAVKAVELVDDVISGTLPPNNAVKLFLTVLDNDWPSTTLNITAVEAVGSPRGTAEVDYVKNIVEYRVSTTGMAVGTNYIDRFRYSAVNGADPTVYTANIALNITIKT